jgi:hypothetical protein
MRDCYPTCCWQVMHFYVFLHDVVHMCLSPGLAHFLLQGYRQLDAGCLGLNLQINRPLMTPCFENHKTATKRPLNQILCFPSVAIMALRRNVLQEGDILCELYVDTRSDVSDYSDNESLDTESNVTTTSSHKQLRSANGPLTPQFPHPLFLTSIQTVFITVWD